MDAARTPPPTSLFAVAPALAPVSPRVEALRGTNEVTTLGAGTPVVRLTTPVAVSAPPAPTSERFAPTPLPSLATGGASVILQRGNAQYFADGHSAKTAARFWLRAYSFPDRARLLESLSGANQAQGGDAGLALTFLHFACLQTDAHQARLAYFAAQKMCDEINSAMSYVVFHAQAHEEFRSLYATLYPTFAALRYGPAQRQLGMVQAKRAGDGPRLMELALGLEVEFAFLLAPKCALFSLTSARWNAEGRPPGLRETLKARGSALLTFVYHLDANGQRNAAGVLDEEAHRGFWRDALEGAYLDDPFSFNEPGPRVSRGLPESERTVMGLPWGLAVSLPFSRSWGEVRTAWRAHTQALASAGPAPSAP